MILVKSILLRRQNDVSRYQLLEKTGTKELYLDNRSGQKVTVRLENN